MTLEGDRSYRREREIERERERGKPAMSLSGQAFSSQESYLIFRLLYSVGSRLISSLKVMLYEAFLNLSRHIGKSRYTPHCCKCSVTCLLLEWTSETMITAVTTKRDFVSKSSLRNILQFDIT
jgi:hypothetical protein